MLTVYINMSVFNLCPIRFYISTVCMFYVAMCMNI